MKTFGTLDELAAGTGTGLQGIQIFALQPDTPVLQDQFHLRLDVIDVVDSTYVVQPVVSYQGPRGRSVGIAAGGSNELAMSLSEGTGQVRVDPHTGYLLISPNSETQPAAGTARLTTSLGGKPVVLTSADTLIGASTIGLPVLEGRVSEAGGGACRAMLTMGQPIDFNVEVRASVMAAVRPIDAGTREITWKHGKYFAYDPQVGNMSLYYDPARNSHLRIESMAGASATNSTFFPARATNEIYFVCDFVDLGVTAVARQPMRQTLTDVVWPPFKNSVFHIDAPVDFYDVANPSVKIMTLFEQSMYLYDYNGITVELLENTIRQDDILRSKWRLLNQADQDVYTKWFVLGDVEPVIELPQEGNRLLGKAGTPAAEYEFYVDSKIKKASIPQRLSLNAVSVRSPIISGAASFQYTYPAQQ